MKKIPKYVSRSKIKIKMSKLRMTWSVIVTEISIKPQQFPTSSCMLLLFRGRDLNFGPVTIKLNRDLDILKMYTENEVVT